MLEQRIVRRPTEDELQAIACDAPSNVFAP